MSTSKADNSGVFKPVAVHTPHSLLRLPRQAIRIRNSGVEFLSPAPFAIWSEMTVELESASGRKADCTGVVVECNGSRHTGYAVSILFLNPSPQVCEQIHHMDLAHPH